MAITEAEFVGIVDRLLESGIPPTAVAHAFEMDPHVVRERMAELRVRMYGAAELAEALANLQWQAYEQAKAMVTEAPYNVRTRFIMAILNRSLSLTGRQSPEVIGNLRNDVLELFTQMGVGSDDLLAGTDTSAFVPVASADVHQDEGSPD